MENYSEKKQLNALPLPNDEAELKNKLKQFLQKVILTQ